MEEGLSTYLQLPPGFRFHPTDEELVTHYLQNKLSASPLPLSIIADVDLYKFDPWELPEMAKFGEQEWYFFSPRERKYPNGARPNRAAGCGYWKATGTDKPVIISGSSLQVGVKKALVFYKGKPPKGAKTKWIMHEYRLIGPVRAPDRKGSMRLDDWVLCRIYKRLDRLPRTEAGDRDDYISFSTQHELKELPPTPTFESFSARMQNEASNFLGGLGKVHGMSIAEDLPREWGYREAEKKKSIVVENRIDDLYSPNNHASSSSTASQPFEGSMSAKLSDIHQMYSLPFNDNRLWSTEAVTALLS
ncbi:hypothetical protein SUGI_0058860 [Cryptomeria japonica]|uniref:NAC transcription factor 32 n=1 Tax=Cryptomeria japonica TaxID=3369 RepID=UPI002408A2C9|nr:NAC transcription factor 32 [Cryptomeria japonica]GLJ07120.1 hypothetical protein SUGI_0058860 [Cryptomeria japonica]